MRNSSSIKLKFGNNLNAGFLIQKNISNTKLKLQQTKPDQGFFSSGGKAFIHKKRGSIEMHPVLNPISYEKPVQI